MGCEQYVVVVVAVAAQCMIFPALRGPKMMSTEAMKKKSRRKRNERQRRQRAAEARMQRLLRMEAAKRQREENVLPPAKRHARATQSSPSGGDLPSPSPSISSWCYSEDELDGGGTERAEPSRARCSDSSVGSSETDEEDWTDVHLAAVEDGDDVEVSSMRDQEAAVLRTASSMQVVDVSCDDGTGDTRVARSQSMMSALDEMVDDELREVENRHRRQVSLGQKPIVPPQKVRIADVGIVRIPDCQRTGKLVKSLAVYPALELSKAWNDVRNFAMYVMLC